jgi:hypothetical protein
MLESLLSSIAAKVPPMAMVPPVPSPKKQSEPLEAMNNVAVPWVLPVLLQKTKIETIAKSELEVTEKTRAQSITEVGEPIEEQFINDINDPFDDRHYCHECRRLINGRCITQRFRPVDDMPRRCEHFSMRDASYF